VTTLLIPGHNDAPAEIEALSAWFVEHLGPDVPLHFTAFHPTTR
jgi:pyruvate formate lyase activating enzyme